MRPVRGAQRPRVCAVPDYGASAGPEAVELASAAGLSLDPWQQLVIKHALGEREDGAWAAFEVAVQVPRQNGKGPHSLETPVLTTGGWTTMGEIAVGARVYGADGQPTAVLATSPILLGERCFEVEFTDGSRHVVGEHHLWHVKRKDDDRGWRPVETCELSRCVSRRRANGRMEYTWRVRCDAQPATPTADVPLDPYLLGYWLGDGTRGAASITTGHADRAWVSERLPAAGAKIIGVSEHASDMALALRFRLDARMRDGFESRCRRLGLWKNKHIPEAYLTASIEQRKALLAGLMDSDGSVVHTNRSPQTEFTTSIPALARDFHRLARSLGIRVAPKWRSTRRLDNCRFLWTPTFNPFQMPRKAAAGFASPISRRQEVMSVVAVREVPSVPLRCIQVERDDGVYLVGRHFTPTHNSILETRELAGLFLLGERMIVHTAHLFDTSLEAFRRLLTLIEENPDFDRRVKRISRAHGEEGIELKGGQRIRFRTRTRGGGRGFTGDCVIFDESMEIALESHGALLPLLSSIPNPQVWYMGSAVDELIHQHGLVIAAIRKRALAGEDPDLLYLEWSVDRKRYESNPDTVARDPRSWAQANPALGIRITPEYVAKERRAMAARPRTFAVERLNIGYWPDPDEENAARVISEEQWKLCTDIHSKVRHPVCFAFDVAPDRSSASIAAAGTQLEDEGRVHVEVVDHRRGTRGLAQRLAELQEQHQPVGIVYDGIGPAASIVPELEALDVAAEPVTGNEYGQACGMFYDLVDGDQLRHLDTPTLNAAVAGAAKRRLGDRWVWSRSSSSVDITELVSVTLATYGHATIEPSRPFDPADYRIRRL